MEVKDIVDKNTVKTNLSVTNKAEALVELADLLLKNEYITETDSFIADIYAREAEGQTGIGNYIAIPHGKSSAVKKVGVAIGILKDEIPWETLDGKGVKGIILFAVGNDTAAAQEHLKLLALFARKLGNDDVIAALLQSQNPSEVVAAFS